MSAQLKSFEGPDVQLVLDRIRRELGPGAKIDRAERIRVGGVLGFFAKEHYRVVVEVPADADAAPAAPTATADDRSSRRARRKNQSADQAPNPTAAVTGDVFSAMADATDDVTEIGSLAAIAPPPAGAETPAPLVAQAPDAAATVPGAEETLVATAPESFDAVLTRVASTLGTTDLDAASHPGGAPPGVALAGPASPPLSPPATAAGDEPSPPEDVASGAALFLAGSGAGPTPVGWRPPPPSDHAGATADPPPGIAPADRGPEDPRVAALDRVGLEAPVIAAVVEGLRRGTSLETLLLQAFTGLAGAPALPRQVGSLLVVVGDGLPARRLAAALAGEMGTDPAMVPFASLDTRAHVVATGPLLVRCAEDAAERAPGWRRSGPVVVVVDAPVAGADRSWATHLIAALRPTAVWGVVEATAKTEDIASWTEDLGGVDALALEHLDATVSPAAILRLRPPVARIDGQPATAARWVATVMDRITPCR